MLRLLCFLLAATPVFAAAPAARALPSAPEGMALVRAGRYTPLYRDGSGDARVAVEAFYLDVHPVTNADFRAFVEANPAWRRSKARRLFADEGYLRHWTGDLSFAPELADRPVVNVSWFAAEAYAAWKGKRLPTTAEWEYAAQAGLRHADGRTEEGFLKRLMALYSHAPRKALAAVGSTPRNYWGVYDLHGLVWEWVHDFNSALVTGESRNNTDLDLGRFCGSAALGASDFQDYTAFLRFGFRSGLEARFTVSNLGFRLAADIPPGTRRAAS